MNAMTNALRVAGAKLPPIKQRIWTWLKDHPEKTSDDVTKALGSTYSLGASMLDMERAGQLKVYSDLTKHVNPMTGQPMKIKRYSAVGREYVKPERKTPVKPAVAAPMTIKQVVERNAAPEFDPESFVHGLSLGKCKELYVYLHGVFK